VVDPAGAVEAVDDDLGHLLELPVDGDVLGQLGEAQRLVHVHDAPGRERVALGHRRHDPAEEGEVLVLAADHVDVRPDALEPVVGEAVGQRVEVPLAVPLDEVLDDTHAPPSGRQIRRILRTGVDERGWCSPTRVSELARSRLRRGRAR
jgi:hypothetical protein